VLILGEPGSGKEVIARAVHAASARASGPFIRVNCGAIPPAQVEVHLFGATLDAGSSAEEHHGWLHRATGGTVFLDEIGALPWAVQERLLHVLAQGQADPRAAAGATTIDVRVVAASDQDLASLVREGRFRQDLWYRLAAFPILLPPLRERQEDIPALARHFAQRAALRFGLPLRMPSADDLTLLMGYSWPGNARELGAVIDRAALLSRGERLEIARALGGAAESPGGTAPAGRAVSLGPLASLDEAIRHHIEAALALTEGRIEGPQGAARLLKINPHTLRARMRKLRIDWGHFRSLRDPAEPR
jgi:DNA-binding NtrC family response regulator